MAKLNLYEEHVSVVGACKAPTVADIQINNRSSSYYVL